MPGIGRSVLTLGAGETLSRVVGFAAAIVLARRLGPAGYGVIALAQAVTLYCAYVADMGVHTLGVRDVAARPAEVDVRVPSLVAGRLVVAVLLAIVVGVAGLAALPQPEGAVLAVYALTLLFVALNTRWALLGLERPAPVALARLAGEGLLLVLVLAFVRETGHLARTPLFQVAGDGLAALALLLVLRRAGQRLRLVVDRGLVRETFGRAWPLVLHSLLGLVIYNSDLVVLRAVRESAAVGLYSAAYALVSFLANLGVAYGLALLPPFTREREGLGAGVSPLYNHAVVAAAALALPAAAGTTFIARDIITLVFGHGYATAATALVVLIWSVPLGFVRTVAQTALIARGRQDLVLRTTSAAAVANVALNVVVIPLFGMVGAAAVTVATEALRTALTFAMARRDGVVTGGVGRLWKALAATGAMVALLAAAPGWPVLARVALGALAFTGALAALGGVRYRPGRLPEILP